MINQPFPAITLRAFRAIIHLTPGKYNKLSLWSSPPKVLSIILTAFWTMLIASPPVALKDLWPMIPEEKDIHKGWSPTNHMSQYVTDKHSVGNFLPLFSLPDYSKFCCFSIAPFIKHLFLTHVTLVTSWINTPSPWSCWSKNRPTNLLVPVSKDPCFYWDILNVLLPLEYCFFQTSFSRQQPGEGVLSLLQDHCRFDYWWSLCFNAGDSPGARHQVRIFPKSLDKTIQWFDFCFGCCLVFWPSNFDFLKLNIFCKYNYLLEEY